jgi:hypothetical protein
MKSWTLAAALPLLAASAVALPQRPSARASDSAAPLTPAPADPRQKALDEIQAWRGFMPQTSPLAADFEQRLKDVEKEFSDLTVPVDAAALVKPQGDFDAWQHDFVVASCKLAPANCASTRQLYDFSKTQRATIQTFARQRAEIMDPKLRGAKNAVDGAKAFYDNDTHQGAVILAPGSYGSPPTADEVNAQPHAPTVRTVGPPPAPGASKPFTLASLTGYLDYSGIKDTAIRAVENIRNDVAGFGKLLTGFAGSCYYGAKWLMIKAGMLPPEVQAPEDIGNIGIGSGRAYMFNAALKHNAKLQAKLHVRPLKLSDISDSQVKLIPEKTVFIFDRGCAGMSDDSGHAELKFDDDKLAELPASAFYRANRRGPKYKPTIAPNEIMACSDGCMLHTAAYLRTYGKIGCLNAYAPVLEHPAAPPVTNAPGI